jgi:hypothetical protein
VWVTVLAIILWAQRFQTTVAPQQWLGYLSAFFLRPSQASYVGNLGMELLILATISGGNV